LLRRYKFFVVFFLPLILSCGGHVKHTKLDVEDYNYDFKETEYQRKCEGSLWTEESAHSILFMDYKARRVNDIITISIVEVSIASGEASTNTGRESSISAGITDLLGVPSHYGLRNLWGRGNDFSSSIGATTKNTFDGTGKTSRKGSLKASITARITKVLPNGNLVVKGKKEVIINNDEQIIIISGIVRPKDISANNTVLSTYIADAKIEYTGKGIIDDKQRPGWLTRLFDRFWPF